MRILLVTSYFEPDQGAAAVRLSRLARQLQARGHQVTVLTTLPNYPYGRILDGYRGKFQVIENRDGVRVIQVWLWATRSPKIALRLLSQLSFMFTAALRGLFLPRPDVVLIEAQPVFTSLAGVFLSRLKRAPYVLNVSDFWPEYLLAVGALSASSRLYKTFYWLVNATFRGARRIVALHPPLAENIESRIGQGQKIVTIYNAVDLERFRPGLDITSFRRQHGASDGEKWVTFIGTFGTHMDFETMLDVAAHFNTRQDVRFVLIGTGGRRGWIEERLAQPDLSRARWIGWLDHADMPLAWNASYITFWALHDHDLYRSTLQSKTYEALGCGTPMVIAVEGITTDLIQRSGAGITVPFKDKAGLIAAITRLLDDESFRRQCSESARAYAEQNFDPDHVAARYEAVLLEAAAQG